MKQISFGFFLVDEALKSYSEHFICRRRVLHGARQESKNGIAQKMYATNCSIQ